LHKEEGKKRMESPGKWEALHIMSVICFRLAYCTTGLLWELGEGEPLRRTLGGKKRDG